MRLKFLLPILFIAYLKVHAQTETTTKELGADPLDVSVQKEQIEKYGVPTISTVDEMKSKADALYDAESWEQAAIAYEVYARHVNWLANLITQCLEPYYSASYDDRKAVSYSTLKSFIPLESKANEYKQNRNESYIRIGLCYKNMGDVKNAVTYLHKGLDLLSVDNIVYWTLAKDAMTQILEFESN